MTSSPRNTIHFLAAAIVLAGSATFMLVAKQQKWLVVIKKPLPIRRPLNDLDQNSLKPWKLSSAGHLPPESEEELGTKEYINWTLSNPVATVLRNRPVSLTVTYYTGVQDQVPHVPEECAMQGGMTQSGSKQIIQWDMPQLGEKTEIAKVVFDSPQQLGLRLYVYYTIAVNGDFRGDRDPVRIRMADPRDTHLYYSKVEVSIFAGMDADQKELDAVGRDLLDKSLSELLRSHFPKRGWERGGPK